MTKWEAYNGPRGGGHGEPSHRYTGHTIYICDKCGYENGSRWWGASNYGSHQIDIFEQSDGTHLCNKCLDIAVDDKQYIAIFHFADEELCTLYKNLLTANGYKDKHFSRKEKLFIRLWSFGEEKHDSVIDICPSIARQLNHQYKINNTTDISNSTTNELTTHVDIFN